jgi:folylpolyglutamate synthase/dihydropteroate synthase
VPAASSRAAAPEELARRFGARGDARVAPGLPEALEELLRDPEAELIIIAGSLYLVGEARGLLLEGAFSRMRP